jgi:hypothetical protein
MDNKTISGLKPASESAAAIGAALNNANAEIRNAEKRHEAAKEQLADGKWLTSAQRRELADIVEDSGHDILQLEAIGLDLGQRLTAAQLAEDHERASNRRADIMKRKAASDATFDAEFAKAIAPARKMLSDRASQTNELNEFNSTDGACFADLTIGGIEEFYRPVYQTRFYQSAADIAAEQERLANEHAINQRAVDEANTWRASEIERMSIEYAQRSQQSNDGACVFIDGVRQRFATPH